MAEETFIKRSRIEAPAGAVFDWHKRPGALERLTPPWNQLKVVDHTGTIKPGDRVKITMKLGGIPLVWVAEHQAYEEGVQFQDVQVRGPFSKWVHTHRIEPDGSGACHLEDHVIYEHRGGRLGKMVAGRFIRNQLEKMFEYRHRVLAADLAAHSWQGGSRKLNIAVTGSHGLVGSTLVPFLTTGDHAVVRLVRGKPQNKAEVQWSPRDGKVDLEKLEGIDAVVHLAGEPITGRWTQEKRRRIHDSRVNGTRLLAESLGKLDRPPEVLICASAIGYYGDRGDEWLDESADPGQGFLADVCLDWEEATEAAVASGIRVVNLRFGIILSPRGGALAAMLPAFKLGLGGPLGRGNHWMSWITLNDVIGAIYHVMFTDMLRGPVNIVTPNSVTNAQFTKTLGRVLRRPTVCRVPRWAARLALGDFADEGLFASTRVRPAKLMETAYHYRAPELEDALRLILGR